MKIITLTLNPAYDVHYNIENFMPYKENYIDSATVSCGGKSINISRALSANGISNTAVLVLGKDNMEQFVTDMTNEGIDFIPLEVDGAIRKNITIHSVGTPETRISFDTFSIDSEVLKKVEGLMPESLSDTIVTFSGRVPKGIGKEEITEFLKRIKARGAKLVLDSNSFSLKEVEALRPWLIKPNEQEIQEYMNVSGLDVALKAARLLHGNGVENVIVSMGKDGAVYAGDGEYCVPAPKITALSTIGAGDSTIAGFIYAYVLGKAPGECLKTAVAFGSAACLTEGTNPPLPEDIRKFL